MRVTEIKIEGATCDCPNCGEEQRTFVEDPRGRTSNCGSCGYKYEIAEDAEIIFE